LNIDFLLGYLKQLLQRRRDLKVIVTSATIDTERFAAHFGGAPVVNVEGRGYPVEVRYRPLDGTGQGTGDRGETAGRPSADPAGTSPSLPAKASGAPAVPGPRSPVPGPAPTTLDGVLAACDEIARERPMGDTLVFLPGEREIRDAHQALERRKYRHTEVLPLYARL